MSTIEAWVATYSEGHPKRKYLAETLESLAKQTVPLQVHILGDDRDAHLKWNEAFDKCTSDYIALPHHDDVYLPNWAETLSGYLDTHPTVVAVFSLDYIINEKGKRVGQTYGGWETKDTYSFKDLMHMYTTSNTGVLRCETVMFNRKVLGDMRCPDKETSGTANDTQFWFELAAKHPIGIVMKPLVKYRVHPESDTQINVVPTLNKIINPYNSTGQLFWSDHMNALHYAATLRPQDVDPRMVIASTKAIETELHRNNAKIIQSRTGGSELLVCHEPPDAAGTGIVVANRVRTLNELDDNRIRYYVYPVEDNTIEVLWANGMPVVKCPVEAFGDVIERLKPSKIEYHHLLRWPLDIINVSCERKELWLHDSFLWCAMYHSVDKSGVVCNDPETNKCVDCSGESAEFLEKKSAFLNEAVGKLDRFVANSEYTARYAKANLGIDCEVIPPSGEPLRRYGRRKRVGYFGGFASVKGVLPLIQAWRVLHRDLPVCPQLLLFCDVSAGWLTEKGRTIAGINDVLVMGSYRRSDLPYLGNLVDLAVIPSINESYGMVKRELESIGVHVLATNTGGLDGTIPPNDPIALAEAIKTALRNQEALDLL